MVALIEYNTMGSKQPAKDFDWGYLIQPDKSPSPRLEQLCLGLAGVIVNIPRPLVFFSSFSSFLVSDA